MGSGFTLSFRRHTVICAYIVTAILWNGSLSAQQNPPPRAQVVEDDDVPKAIPIERPGTMPRPAIVVEDVPTPPPAVRKGPDEDLYTYASLLFERAEWPIAAQSFAQYLQNYPSGVHVPEALFRIGECYMKQSLAGDAARYYEEVVARYPKSEGAPSAAYRLGATRFNAREFEDSVKFFKFCETHSTNPLVTLAATYNRSQAHDMLGQKKEQLTALQAVIAVEKDNPYRESALLTLGRTMLKDDKVDEALKMFKDLIATTKEGKILAEASVNVGVLLSEKKQNDEALAYFEKALELPDTPDESRGVALVGVVQSLYAKGDYKGVVDWYNRNASVLPPGESRPKMLLLVGNAHRMSKTYSRAVEVYLLIEQNHPDSEQAFEAGYWKLYCFYLLDDKDLGDFASSFLARYNKKYPDHEFVSLAALIRADFYFNKGDFAESAESFLEVKLDKLPEKLRPGALFNQGYAQVEADKSQDAIATLSLYLTDYAQPALIPRALVYRGIAYRKVKDMVKAGADFERVVKEFGNGDEAEMAFYQLGLISTEQRDVAGIVNWYEQLVKRFPDSKAAGQAWFGIGKAEFEQKHWTKALPALETAVRKNSKDYLETGSQMIFLCHYANEDIDGLASAIDTYLAKRPGGSVPPNVLGWLGLSLFAKEDFPRSVKYLEMATTPASPANTQPAIWNYLSMAKVETGDFDGAVVAADNYLAVTPPSGERGQGLLTKSKALLGKKDFSGASAVAQEGLSFIKTGRLQAQLMMEEGDILMAEARSLMNNNDTAGAMQKFAAAAAKYIVPSQMFVDPEITPLALFHAIEALVSAGEKAKAEELVKQLKEKYPDFDAKKYIDQQQAKEGR
jgi:TolA-binding protein